MSERFSRPPYQHNKAMEDEISLLDLAITLAKHKKLIIGLPIVVFLVAAIFTHFIPNTYTATTRILPIGGNYFSKDIFISILKSQPVADSLVKHLKLEQSYNGLSPDAAREMLMASSKFALAKDGSIEIAIEDRNPRRAAELANGYAQQINWLGNVYSLTEASTRRRLFEKQLTIARQDLDASEKALAEVNQRVHLNSAMIAKIEFYVKASTGLKAQIAMKELEIAAMRNGKDFEKNPLYFKLQQEVSAFWMELEKVENGVSMGSNVTADESEYLSKLREQVYAETKYTELKKQVDLARLEESQNTPDFQILERASIPVSPSKPARSKIVTLAVLASGLLAIFWAFLAEALYKTMADENGRARFQILLDNLRWK